jgi:hypothetical protein
MACYAADLVAGQNLLCMTLKAGTILRYLQAAAELSIPANMMNPCLDITGKQSKYIRDIINEVKRWESVPDRREPVTKDMIEYIFNKGISLKKSNKDNIYTSLADWLIIGQQSGFRRKEWAQDRSHLKKYKDIQRNVDGSSSAFILSDFEFRGKNNRRIDQDSNTEVSKACIVNIKWRFQKNNDNGQIISYVADNLNKIHCYLKACKRIRERAIRLKQALDKPIAVYKSNPKDSKLKYIDDIHVSDILQEAAKAVYHITNKNELKRFTSHSIRVGACVLLHSQNTSTEDIKFRLRWRSDSFRMYLRNIIQLAEKHCNVDANIQYVHHQSFCVL